MNGVLSSVLVMLGVIVFMFAAIMFYRKMLDNKRQGTPFESQTPRKPGQSLQQEVDRVRNSVRIQCVALITGVCLIGAGHLAFSHFGKVPESWGRTMVSICGGSIYAVFFLWRWIHLTARQGRLRMGLNGEMAVGQALEQMNDRGYRIYHDFPAETFNIDHIVIGPFGVMAVETKTRRGGKARRGRGDAIVSYDGRMLHFPKNSDHQTIDKAKHQAAWLSEWLSASMQDPISARAIVAIPDWHVKRTSADGIPVVNPKQFSTLFDHISQRPLSQDMAHIISQRIEQQYIDALEGSADSASNQAVDR